MSDYIIRNGELISLELYHHGIKGQKWGIRRFQKKDGSLTSAGKKRYYDTPELNKQKAAVGSTKKRLTKAIQTYNESTSGAPLIPNKEYKAKVDAAKVKLDSARQAHEHAKLRYSTNKELARMKDKDISIEKKSKHRSNLEEKYKSLGMSDEQAQAAANKRIRSEKIVAGAAAVAVTACAAYVVNKKLKDRIDGVIKSGETLQRVEMQDTNGKLYDMFYAAKGKHDVQRYKGMLGMTRQQQTGEAYLMKLKAAGDVKVASKENARKVFEQLYKEDPEFKKAVSGYAKIHFTGQNRVDIDNLSKRNMKKMYENFNSALLHIRADESGADKKFYNALKAKGYGAIQDINDMKFSGYSAKNPLIIFDNSKNNIMVESVTKLENMRKEGMKEYAKAQREVANSIRLPALGGVTAAYLTSKAATTYRSDPTKNYKDSKKKLRW